LRGEIATIYFTLGKFESAGMNFELPMKSGEGQGAERWPASQSACQIH
jgi:hypothetical protein